MADEDELSETPTNEAFRQEVVDWDGRDSRLTNIVEVVNNGNFALGGLTLSVSGQLISGKVISHKKWHDLLRERSTEAFAAAFARLEGEAPNDLNDKLATLMLGAEIEDEPNPAETVMELPRFIHLSDAALVTSNGGMPTTGGVLWRVKIASVDGWSLGV